MIRGLTTIKRSTAAAPAKLFHRNGLSDFTRLRPLALARNFNTYPQPFPYYGGQVNSCQYDPYQRYYANRNAYQFNPNFAHFHPGVYGPHPRFGYQFRGPYPVGGAWRSFGPEYRCRCCGCQQFLPVNYGGNWNWNPNAGMYRGGVVQGNGYVDQGIDYNRGDWSQMRRDTFQNNTGGGRGNFNGNDGRNLGPYDANSSDFPRNQNENGGRDYNANQNQNVGQHRQNLGDSYNERQEVPRVNGFEEQKIAHHGNRRPQDAYRWNNHNFTENDGRDGRDQVAWTQSRSSYNPYGPEHSFHSESERLNQGTGYVDRKNVDTDNQTRPSNNGGAIGGQFQNSTVNGRPLNSNGAGGGEEYKQTGQSSRVPDALRKDNNHGSNEHDWSVNSQSGSNPVGGQYEKRFNVANNSEASRLFQDNKGAKQDGIISRYDESRNGSNLGNMFDPLPNFTANEPLNPSRTNAQMPNINETGNSGGRPPHTIVHDSNDATRMSIDASRRYRPIVDVLDTEDYPRSNRTNGMPNMND